MAHWAKIDENGIVEAVIVTSNDDADEGESWIAENLDGTWLKTSYNTRRNRHVLGGQPFRKNFAQPGYYYDAELDAFIPSKLEVEANFILDSELGIWVPPIPKPEDGDIFLNYDNFEGEIPNGSKVYFWMFEENAWGLLPCGDKPEGSFVWNALQGQWIQLVPQNRYPSDTQVWPSWIQNNDGLWVAPVEKPYGTYLWDESSLSWTEFVPPTE